MLFPSPPSVFPYSFLLLFVQLIGYARRLAHTFIHGLLCLHVIAAVCSFSSDRFTAPSPIFDLRPRERRYFPRHAIVRRMRRSLTPSSLPHVVASPQPYCRAALSFRTCAAAAVIALKTPMPLYGLLIPRYFLSFLFRRAARLHTFCRVTLLAASAIVVSGVLFSLLPQSAAVSSLLSSRFTTSPRYRLISLQHLRFSIFFSFFSPVLFQVPCTDLFSLSFLFMFIFFLFHVVAAFRYSLYTSSYSFFIFILSFDHTDAASHTENILDCSDQAKAAKQPFHSYIHAHLPRYTCLSSFSHLLLSFFFASLFSFIRFSFHILHAFHATIFSFSFLSFQICFLFFFQLLTCLPILFASHIRLSHACPYDSSEPRILHALSFFLRFLLRVARFLSRSFLSPFTHALMHVAGILFYVARRSGRLLLHVGASEMSSHHHIFSQPSPGLPPLLLSSSISGFHLPSPARLSSSRRLFTPSDYRFLSTAYRRRSAASALQPPARLAGRQRPPFAPPGSFHYRHVSAFQVAPSPLPLCFSSVV